MAKMKWRLEGYDGAEPTGFSVEVVATKNQMMLVLERLTARHLTDREIVEDTLSSSGTLFGVHRDKQRGKPVRLMTTSTGHHYVAVEA